MLGDILMAIGMLALLAGVVLLVIWLVKKLLKKQARIWLPLVLLGAGCIVVVAGTSLLDEDKPPAETATPLKVSSLSTAEVKDFVQPTDPLVRDTAVGLISGAPAGINQDSPAWKIWQINYWVANNIDYVSDPAGHEYFATASETLDTKGGDCDDFAVLLASMYEAIGLDAALVSVDVDGNKSPDHLTCAVYYAGTGETLLEEVKDIMVKAMISPPTGRVYIKFIESKKSQLSEKYKTGIWVIADPPMAEVRDMVGYITHSPYNIEAILDIGY